MKSSGQKTGFSIAVMIGVIIAAGITVDWWDARQSRLLPRTPDTVATDDAVLQRLSDENERLKTENALLNIQNDALRKKAEELARKPAELSKENVVEGEKPLGD